tara:strand:+ start:1312 stop:2004 length:693 start_codon:yes stop_codon:yes gene_type:complete
MYSPGDLIIFKVGDQKFYGEIVGIAESGKIEVSRLKKTAKQEGRIWHFVDDDKWSAIDSNLVTKHVAIPEGSTRDILVKAWKEIGFIPGGDGMTFCRAEDEENTTLPLYQGEESSDDEDTTGLTPSNKAGMHGYASDDGFIVPDDEGEEFDFADPDDLSDDEAAEFVRETHRAVREFDNWQPKDKQEEAIKKYIERMDHTATIQTDNQRFAAGKETIRTSKPPLKKRRKE